MKEKQKTLLKPKTDVVFQALFGVQGSERILGGLLSKIIDENVENISLEVNQNLIRRVPEDKLGVLDLRAKIGDIADVDIEVQLQNKHNIPERGLNYWAKMHAMQLKSGEKYQDLKKTILILILDFELKELKKFENAHAKHQIHDLRDPKVIVFKNLEIHIIELPKIIKYPEKTEEGLKTWMKFLMDPESEVVKMGAKEDKKLGEAVEKLEYISGDDELRRIAELREKYILDEASERAANREEGLEEGLEEGKKEGRKEGIIQGKKQERLEIAKKLLKIEMPIKQIIEITELTEEEILSLK